MPLAEVLAQEGVNKCLRLYIQLPREGLRHSEHASRALQVMRIYLL